MGEYSNEKWYIKAVEKYTAEYGDVPPHWKIFPNTHPYSIGWRMGAGETFAMVFTNWFEDTFKEEEEKIRFFFKYSPPPRWLVIMASYVWDIELELKDDLTKSNYLNKLEEIGFSGTKEYFKDLEDPKWV